MSKGFAIILMVIAVGLSIPTSIRIFVDGATHLFPLLLVQILAFGVNVYILFRRP